MTKPEQNLSPALSALLGLLRLKTKQEVLKMFAELLACRTKEEYINWRENNVFSEEGKINLVFFVEEHRLLPNLLAVIDHLRELGVN